MNIILNYNRDSDLIEVHVESDCKLKAKIKLLRVAYISECKSSNPLVCIPHPIGFNLSKQIFEKFEKAKNENFKGL